jgi:hypothetical protein
MQKRGFAAFNLPTDGPLRIVDECISAQYPAETKGTRWAGEARRMAGKLKPEEEAAHFARAMAKIHGGRQVR